MIWLDVFMPDNCLKASSTHRLQGTHSHCSAVTMGILIHVTTARCVIHQDTVVSSYSSSRSSHLRVKRPCT